MKKLRKKCPVCKGRGFDSREDEHGNELPCNDCLGTGFVLEKNKEKK